MKAIQAYYREQEREPTDVELETIAQTWSEHCVHKTLKSAVDVEVRDEIGQDDRRASYGNLIKETIFDSTQELMPTPRPDRTSACRVFKDNAGVVAFDDDDAVCFKVETHNHPSAIEPYGGSATGVGGVHPRHPGHRPRRQARSRTPTSSASRIPTRTPRRPQNRNRLPKGVIHPKRILQQVVAGVRDYGNRMGIPTVNGAVYFDDRYLGNPLVFCGCVGLIPRDKIDKDARAGDAIVVMGGRTGRDGIHGATFSSRRADRHARRRVLATPCRSATRSREKKMADVILQARDRGLFTAITDCGAGGLVAAPSARWARRSAPTVELDNVPLKYAGLRYDEIWISEAQERMVLSVPQEKVDELLKLAGERRRRGDRHRHVRHRRRGADPQLPRQRSRPAVDGLPAQRHPDADAEGGRRERQPVARASQPVHSRESSATRAKPMPRCHDPQGRSCSSPRPSEHRQQALDHPPVRPRGAGRVA